MTATCRVIPFSAPTSDAPVGEWAEFYAGLGWKVIPNHTPPGRRCSCDEGDTCPTPGKHPRISSWNSGGASSDPAVIAAWWQRWPTANVGILTGDGLVVFDIDPRNGGIESWDRAMTAPHRFPATPFVLTGGGGIHYYMRDPTGRVRGSKGTLGPGVDVLVGANAIAPPSVHSSGGRYRWAKGYGPRETRGLPEIPGTLLDLLAPVQPKPDRPRIPAPPPRRGALPTPIGRGALDKMLTEIAQAPEGTRHATIYSMAAWAGDLARAGHLEVGSTFDLLVDAGTAAGGDPEAEVARTVHDGMLEPARGGRGGAA